MVTLDHFATVVAPPRPRHSPSSSRRPPEPPKSTTYEPPHPNPMTLKGLRSRTTKAGCAHFGNILGQDVNPAMPERLTDRRGEKRVHRNFRRFPHHKGVRATPSNDFHEDVELTPLLRLGAGACAGIIAMSATYPMDMVRERLTVQTMDSPYQYRGIFHAMSTRKAGSPLSSVSLLACQKGVIQVSV
ncbi:Mitochondrial adenine nucleotide transporter ADNT1-like protein [Drosera capensis]